MSMSVNNKPKPTVTSSPTQEVAKTTATTQTQTTSAAPATSSAVVKTDAYATAKPEQAATNKTTAPVQLSKAAQQDMLSREWAPAPKKLPPESANQLAANVAKSNYDKTTTKALADGKISTQEMREINSAGRDMNIANKRVEVDTAKAAHQAAIKTALADGHLTTDEVSKINSANSKLEGLQGQLNKMQAEDKKADLLDKASQAKPQPKPEAKPQPKPEAKPKPKTEAKPKPKAETKPKPKTETKPKPKAETKPKTEGPKTKPAGGSSPTIEPGKYDGKTPAKGTTETNIWGGKKLTPPLSNGKADRSASNYSQVINQFAAGNNPRYTPRAGSTYCNVFAQDVMKQMGAPLPAVRANDLSNWLNGSGGANAGWKKVSAAEAQKMANQGHPALVTWKNPKGHPGHVGVVRPGEITSQGPSMAQAGSKVFNNKHVKDGFGNAGPLQYWVHA